MLELVAANKVPDPPAEAASILKRAMFVAHDYIPKEKHSDGCAVEYGPPPESNLARTNIDQNSTL